MKKAELKERTADLQRQLDECKEKLKNKDQELKECQEKLDKALADISKEAIAAQNAKAQGKDVIEQNAKLRQSYAQLRAERDALQQRLDEESIRLRALQSDKQAADLLAVSLKSDLVEKNGQLQVLQRDKEAASALVNSLKANVDEKTARLQELEKKLICRDAEIQAAMKQLGILEHDKQSTSAALNDQREACALLESEKDELKQKCTRLEDEWARLIFLEAKNVKLLANIELIEKQSDAKCASIAKESEAVQRQLKEEHRIHIANMEQEAKHRVAKSEDEKQEADKKLARSTEDNKLLREKLYMMSMLKFT